LKPHLSRTFKVSSDPAFAEKLEVIVGLYLNPPEHALVLCADEMDRTQPGLPLKKDRCGTMTYEYKRNGTATLFAAMNALDGTIISLCEDRHRHQEWLKFLRLIDQSTPQEKTIYLIAEIMPLTSTARCSDGLPATGDSTFTLLPTRRFVAQHYGTILPGSHRQTYPPRCLPQCG
jgi:hypothetical protein